MIRQVLTKNEKLIINKLRAARKEAGLNQNKAAILLHKTQSFISKIESGRSRVCTAQLKDFAKIYKKSVEYFIT